MLDCLNINNIFIIIRVSFSPPTQTQFMKLLAVVSLDAMVTPQDVVEITL